MIVGVVTDLDMTFTGGHFNVAWQNNDFDFKVLIPQKKNWLWSSQIQVSDPGQFLLFPQCFLPSRELSAIFIQFRIVCTIFCQLGSCHLGKGEITNQMHATGNNHKSLVFRYLNCGS